jgi:hypothetical protein
MITLGAKLYFGLSAAALAAAFVLGWASGGSFLGVITFAWAGPIGDQLGYTVLASTAAISFFLGVVITAFRDADPEAQTQVAGTDTLPAATPPAHLSPWPIVAAFGVAVLLVGLVVDSWLVGIGLVLLAAAAVEWTVDAYSDRATGDPVANRAIRNRLMAPIETPAASFFGVFIFVFFASRILLAASKWGAIAIFGAAATVVLIVATVIVSRPSLNRNALTGLLLVGGLALVGGGVAGLAAGEREFHYLGDHGENGEHDAPDGVDETDPPGLGLDGDVADTEDDSNAGDTSE